MATILTASTEAELDTDIAEANAAASGGFVIDVQGDITETANLTPIALQSGVMLIIDGSNGSGGSFTLDGAGSFNGIQVDAGGTGSAVTIENLVISDVPSAQPAKLSGGTLSGTVTISISATVEQTANVALGAGTVTNQGTIEFDQLTAAGTDGPAITGVAGSLLVNDGTLVKLDNGNYGVCEISVDVTDTGTLWTPNSDSNLRFDGASNSFSGTYVGAGMIDYGDPSTFQKAGNSDYSINTLGTIEMTADACTTSWADVNQNGEITVSSDTTITNYGTWNFTSDKGFTLADPSTTSEFSLSNTGILEKTGGAGTTVFGVDFDPYDGRPFTDQGGFIDIDTGTLAFDGLSNRFFSVISGAGTFNLGGGGADALDSGTTISTGGWTITGAGTDVTLNVPLRYSGVFAEQSGATLTLTPSDDLTLSNATFDGTVTGGGGAIVLASGGTLEIDDLASIVSGSQVQNFNAPIGGFADGDTLRLEGFGEFATINGISPSYNSGTNTTSLTLTDHGSTVATLELTGGNFTDATVKPDVISGAVDIGVACFCRGTLILTERGGMAVEDLAIGDAVVTLSGAARPIRWIGRRSYAGRFVAGNRQVLPISIMAGAIAEGVPARDLLVSPEHSLYIHDLLVPAGLLANGATITRVESAERVDYFHLELETHDIILAEGAPTESYVDCDNRFMFQNGAECARLGQGDVPAPWAFCAPRVQPGSGELAGIRAALLKRAEELGDGLTDDPGLHLLIDGAVVRSDKVAGGVHCFAIPAGCVAVRLASRHAVPAEIEAGAHDIRRLGVAVERIALSDGARSIGAGHGDAALCEGFHEDEGTHRWTDGLARLPDAWLRSFPGGAMLEVHLILTGLRYRLPAPARIDAA